MLISVLSGPSRSVAGLQARWGPSQGVAATAIGTATVATVHARLLGVDALSHGGFVHEAGPSPRCTELCATAGCRHCHLVDRWPGVNGLVSHTARPGQMRASGTRSSTPTTAMVPLLPSVSPRDSLALCQIDLQRVQSVCVARRPRGRLATTARCSKHVSQAQCVLQLCARTCLVRPTAAGGYPANMDNAFQSPDAPSPIHASPAAEIARRTNGVRRPRLATCRC